jgi:hypothetical protein
MSAEVIDLLGGVPDRDVQRQWERDQMELALRDNAVMPPSDRRRVAVRLARMIEDAGAVERGWKTKLAHLAWPGAEAPLKKLDLVTLPLDAEPGAKRLARLAKKPRHYAALAAALATVCGRQRQDVHVELFRGTRIEAAMAVQANRFVDIESDDWDKLAELIAAMTIAVCRRTDMRGYLRTIAGRAGTYSLDTRTIRVSSSLLLPHGPLANGYELGDEFPPIPSVPLFATALAAPFDRGLKLAVNGNEQIVPVTVAVWRQTRLAIGPADDCEMPQPLFEFRTVVEIVDEAGRNWADRRTWFYLDGSVERFLVDDPMRGELAAEIELGAEPDTEGGWIPLLEDDHPRAGPTGRQWEHVYAVWWPVTPLSCAEVLGVRHSQDGHVPQFDLGVDRASTFLPNGIIGSWIEAALTHTERPLERALEAEAHRLIAAVQAHVVRIRSEAEAAHRQALKGWANRESEGAESND